MKLEDVKTGEKYRVLDSWNGSCAGINDDTEYIIISDSKLNGTLFYTSYNKEGVSQGSCSSCLEAEDIEPYKKEKTLENLEVGDILVDWSGYKSMVLAICGKVYCLSMDDDFKSARDWYTISELENYLYSIYQEPEPPKVQELTVEEISEKLGYEVKVVKNK